MDRTERNGDGVVVAGFGEIGKAIYRLCESGFTRTIIEDPKLEASDTLQSPVLALHIAMPGVLMNFEEEVVRYAQKYQPKLTLIHSTTRPGTTDRLASKLGVDKVVHTQVHGKHARGQMLADMLRYPKFVATSSDIAFGLAKDVLTIMGHPSEKIVRLSSPLAGEMCKLLATSFYGYLIVWMQEMERLSKKSGVRLEELMAFQILETDDFDIRNKYPGEIGGHCIVQNMKILEEQFYSPLWQFMRWSNVEKIEAEKDDG